MQSAPIRIMFCEPVPEGKEEMPQWAWWRQTVETVARPGTTVDIAGLAQGFYDPTTYEQSFNSVQMAQRAYKAEKEGYDAFIIGCASDMAVRECRAIVDIPVIAPTEATAHILATMGRRFSVIDLSAATTPTIEDALAEAGLMNKLASIRVPPGMTVSRAARMAMSGEAAKLAEIFSLEMARAVIEDRAEALCVSCMITSAAIASQGVRRVEGAPVLDMFAASIKMAELLVDLKRAFGISVCKRSIYNPPKPGWEARIPF